MKKILFIAASVLIAGFFFRAGGASQSAQASYVVEEAQFNPYARVGLASWYSRHSPGIRKTTANNEIFNDRDMTCAMWGVPFNMHVRVTNVDNGKSVVLRVNDRGPHERFVRQGRIIDLTQSAFALIGNTDTGLINVKVEFLI